jgi:transposase
VQLVAGLLEQIGEPLPAVGRLERNVGLAADLGQQRKERPRVVDDPSRQDLVAGLVEDRDVRALAMQVDTAHPLRTKAIASARVKTDAVDARTLAHLLRADLLPEAYIAPRELRDLRDLLPHRVALTRMRSSLKNRVAAILAKNGIAAPYSDMFGPSGLRFLQELELREPARRRLDSMLTLIADFDREIDQTSREIDAPAKADPYVEVLCQIRGVGRYIAMLVIAEVGDISRFATARRLCAWAGLTPTVRSSDGRARLGHISRQGSPALRWALVEAAQQAGRGGGPLREAYEQDAPRQAGRQGRRRPQDPHPLLLRPARRRDPLPGAPGQGAHAEFGGGHTMIRRTRHVPTSPARAKARASSLAVNGLRAQPGRQTAAHLIEPPSAARHNGPA